MPFLERWMRPSSDETKLAVRAVRVSSLFKRQPALPICANPECSSAWIKPWRARQTPSFEEAWTCSAECMKAFVEIRVRSELEGRGIAPPEHRHRVPVGLVLLEQGWITREQLKNALHAQRNAASGRIGMWLMREGLEEHLLTKALSLQWNCPVFSIEDYRPERVVAFVPRLFVDTFGILPLRVAGSSLLYVAFEDQMDRCATLAIERMTGLTVEAGLAAGSEFRRMHEQILNAQFPRARILETTSVHALVLAFTKALENAKPVKAKLVRMRNFFWLRMRYSADNWDLNAIEDVVCSMAQFQ